MITAEFVASVVTLAALPHDPRPHIAMVGRSNVGKSSLINHLANRKNLARISSEPGRTQTMNLYNFDDRFFLVDLPGYGYAKAAKSIREGFAGIIEEYLTGSETLRCVLLLIDARIELSPLDVTMMEWLTAKNIPFVIVLNKMDKVKRIDADRLHATLNAQFPSVRRIEHSKKDGKAQKTIWGAIEGVLRTDVTREKEDSSLPIFPLPKTLED